MKNNSTLIVQLAVVASLLYTSAIYSQTCTHEHSNGLCQLEAVYEDQFTFVAPPENYVPGEQRDVTITVDYNGFTPQAQEAFAYAVDIWASVLTSNIPIHIEANFSSIGPGVLGYASADGYFRNFAGAEVPSTYYPEALANKLHGADLSPDTEDISCTFNSTMNWYFGTDGNVPSGHFDFVSVVLHELGHGLGFSGSASVTSSQGMVGFNSSLTIYDTFAEDAAGMAIGNYNSPSPSLLGMLTSGNVFWNGSFGMAGNDYEEPMLYAPTNWNNGSSYSHLDESTYNSGSGNSLMTPFLGSAEAVHNPGSIVRGMFKDMGWDVASACEIAQVVVGSQMNCGQNGNTYDQQLTLYYDNEPEGGQLIINEQSFPVTGSPQSVILQDLPTNGQEITLDISFTDDILCGTSIQGELLAPVSCCAQFRLMEVNPENEQITIKNFGDCEADISNYLLVSESKFAFGGTLDIISGQRNVPAGETVTFFWSSWNPGSTRHELALYKPNADPDNPSDLLDYVQWAESNSGHEYVAQASNKWNSGDFINAVPPYNFTGVEHDYGLPYWVYAALPCDLLTISAGAQGACNGVHQTFTQELILTYENPPLGGHLSVNDQLFEITGSPQTVLLQNLPANGQPVIVHAHFTDRPQCSMSVFNVFSAPQPCDAEEWPPGNCPGDLDNNGSISSSDLLMLLAAYGCTNNCLYDITQDGDTNTSDLLVIISLFGTQCQ